MKVKNQQIKFLFDIEFPKYQRLVDHLLDKEKDRAAKSAIDYVRRAEVYLDKITALFEADPKKFHALVKEAEIKQIGPLHTIKQCAEIMAEKKLPDDGYEETKILRLKYQELCKRCLWELIVVGALPFFNPHTLKKFDTDRLLASSFPMDGLIATNSLQGYMTPSISELASEKNFFSKIEDSISENVFSSRPKKAVAKSGDAMNADSASNSSVSTDRLELDSVTLNQAGRITPKGGDALTLIIWEICYNLKGANKKTTPMHVMRELKNRSESPSAEVKGPLMSSIAGGVKFEDLEGNERELTRHQLASRINEWKRKTIGKS